MSEETNIENTADENAVLPAETPSIVDAQKTTAKEVKKQVKKAQKAEPEKIIKKESNLPRADKKYIEEGDLWIPVE